MSKLDPVEVFERLQGDFPRPLQKHIFVVGSLAAAYHFRAALEDHAVNTKDADVVIHPAGHVTSCKKIAERLLRDGWTRLADASFPQEHIEPLDDLRTLRLYPPRSRRYFIEFLGLPKKEQREARKWTPIRIDASGHAGWYGLPCFRFMGLASVDRLVSHVSITYGAPHMMALANLLSHETVGAQTMSTPMAGRTILRSAKDLGRVLAVARLSKAEDVAGWTRPWLKALKTCFPKSWRTLGRRAGNGLRAVLDDPHAFEQAHHTTRVGLLLGQGVTQDQLRAVADQLFETALDPLRATCK
ncbi:MAG: hypothetical protein HYY16_12900 [Planctomycetes bacterium]|nr:hypothetical protein [Planctomycetota bacterium]